MNNLLQVEHLNKQYPGFALKDVSFSVKPGRIMGLIGKNGAGKSTTFKIYFKIWYARNPGRYHAGQRFLWT